MTEREIGDLAVNEKVDYTTDKLSGAAAEKSASLSGGAASKRLVVIEYQQVVKGFGEKMVLPGFSLAINQGEFVTIVGASGCGKTTLLKLTNGLLLPDEGFGDAILGVGQLLGFELGRFGGLDLGFFGLGLGLLGRRWQLGPSAGTSYGQRQNQGKFAVFHVRSSL